MHDNSFKCSKVCNVLYIVYGLTTNSHLCDLHMEEQYWSMKIIYLYPFVLKGLGGSMSWVVGLPDNSYKPIANMAWKIKRRCISFVLGYLQCTYDIMKNFNCNISLLIFKSKFRSCIGETFFFIKITACVPLNKFFFCFVFSFPTFCQNIKCWMFQIIVEWNMVWRKYILIYKIKFKLIRIILIQF